jgi:hypothetical protein
MRKTLAPTAFVLAAVLASPASAQDGGIASGASARRMLRAILLPLTSGEARKAGIADVEIRELLGLARQRRIPADEMELVLREEVRSARQHGPIDNFGAFVQDRLDHGLRGRELATAIRSEHERRGMGRRSGGKTKAKDREAKKKDVAEHRDNAHRKNGNGPSDKRKGQRDHSDKKKGQER